MKKLVLPVIAGLALASYHVPSMAKSTIGGIVFLNTYVDKQDAAASGTTDGVTKTKIEVPGNSRLRVKWDNEDRVSMYTELGVGPNGVGLRHLWGKWDMSEKWQILAGHTSTPFAPLNPSVAMVNNSGNGWGNPNPSRQAQLRLTRKFLNRQGAWAIAILDPNNGSTLVDEAGGGASDLGTKNTTMPRIDFGMAYKTFNWQIFPGAFYQKQSYNNLNTAGSDSDVTTYGLSLGAKTAFGPLTITAEVGAGQNWGNTKMSGSPVGAVIYDDAGVNKLADTDNMSYFIDAGYRFTGDEIKGVVHFIYGADKHETKGPANSSADNERSRTMIGLSVPIDFPWIARGFRIRPEVFRFDNGDTKTAGTTTDSGVRTIFGVQFQYTF